VIDTQHDIVPTRAPTVRPPRPIHRAWAIPAAVLAFATMAVLLVASMLSASLAAENTKGQEAPYALVPADATEVAPRIAFDAVERHEADGDILFVTVREPAITLLDWFVARDEPAVVPRSDEDKFGVQTAEQKREVNLVMMRTAKQNAEYVALDFLGYPAEILEGEIIVGQLLCFEANEDGTECLNYVPADDVLDVGDRLLELDGKELTLLEDLEEALKGHQPGDKVEVVFERPGEGERSGEIELIESPTDEVRTIVGFSPFDTATAELAFEVSIDSGEIGGPSAGLAFTLTLIDELTPGELTGGRSVAVTGTIDINGNVGAIGGLASKTSAVRQMGADIFIVPEAQGEEDLAKAQLVAGDEVEIIAVATLEEAVAALAERGGNGLDLGRPGEGYQPE
jgi:PDZ domain-containing protein